MLNGYLDDGQVTRITLTGLDTTAFATYDLYIYMVADTTPSTAGHFIAPEVNGVKYTTGGKAGDANWGNRGTYQRPVLDVNTLRIVGLSNTTGEVVIRFDAVTNRGQGRSCVSAIQVVKSQPQLSHTVGSGENLWSTGWMGGGVSTDEIPAFLSDATLSGAGTMTLDVAPNKLTSLQVTGGAIAFAKADSLDAASLKALKLVVDGDTDITAIDSEIDTAVIAAGKTLTVKSLSSPALLQVADATSAVTLQLPSASDEVFVGSYDPRGCFTIAQGTLKIDQQFKRNASYVVKGANAKLVATCNDPFNQQENYAGGITLADGGTLELQRHTRLPETVRVSGTGAKLQVTDSNYGANNYWRSVSLRKVVLEKNATATFERSRTNRSDAGFHLWQTEIDVADGAALTLDAPLMKGCNGNGLTDNTYLKKKGAGQLTMTAPEVLEGFRLPACNITVEAGTLTLRPSSATVDVGSASFVIAGGTLVLDSDQTSAISLTNGLSGTTGLLKKVGSGTMLFPSATFSGTATVEGGTLGVGKARPTIARVATGAKLQLTATANEIASGKIVLPTTGASFAESCFKVLTETGDEVAVQSVSVDGTTLTLQLPDTTPSVAWGENRTRVSWSDMPWSHTVTQSTKLVVIRGGESAEQTLTVALDAAVPSNLTNICVFGYVAFETSAAQATLPNALELQAGAVVSAQAGFTADYTIPTQTTLIFDGVESAQALTVAGTLQTKGATTLTGAVTVSSGGVLEVAADTSVLTLANKGISGTVKVAADAVLETATSEAVNYDATPIFDIAGTLRVTESARWSLPASTDFTLRAGAVLEGDAEENQYPYAYDFYNGATIKVLGDAEIAGKIGSHNSGTVNFDVQTDGATVTVTGDFPSAHYEGTGIKVKKSGSGGAHLRIESACTLANEIEVATGYLDLAGAGKVSCPISLASGTALTLAPDTSAELTLPGAITNGGRVDFLSGTTRVEGVISGSGALNVKAGAKGIYAPSSEQRLTSAVTVEASGVLAFAAPTLTITQNITGGGEMDVVSGKVITSGANGNFGGKWVVAPDATLSNEGSGNSIPFATANGSIEVNGDLLLAGSGLNAQVPCKVSGAGNVTVNQTTELAGTLTFTGVLTVAEEKSAKGLTFLSGPSLCCQGTVTRAENAILRVASGRTLSGAGSVAGEVMLDAGATLDVSGGALTVGSLDLPTTAKKVTLVLAETAAVEDVILRFADAAPTEAQLAVFDSSNKRLKPALAEMALKLVGAVTVPAVGGSDQGTLSEASQAILLGFARDNLLGDVQAITGATAKGTLSAGQIDAALTCFDTGVLAVDGANIRVYYDFGVAEMVPMTDATGAVSQVKVRVKVQGKDGAAVWLTSAAKLELIKNDAAGTLIGDAFITVGDDSPGLYEATFNLEQLTDPVGFHIKAVVN